MNTLRAWLRPNLLTKEDKSDYTAIPASAGSLNIDDIIKALQAEGMEIRTETAKDILSRFNRKVSERVCAGYSVNTGLVQMKPSIKGVFHDKTFDKAKHSVYVSINQGLELRKAIAETNVEILGIQQDPIAILGVEDKSTNKTDGTATKGKVLEIRGSYLKIVGDHPNNGIYFTNTESKAKTKVEPSDIVTNDPSKLMIMVPTTLTVGTYELSVTTQYSSGNTLIKTPRTAVSEIEITIA